MRRALNVVLFSLGLLVVLIGLVSLAERSPPVPASIPAVTPTPSRQPAPATPFAPPETSPVTTIEHLPLGTPPVTTVEELAPDLTPDADDPVENDAPGAITITQSFGEAANLRHAHLVFDLLLRNDGPGEVTLLDVYVTIPSDRDNQRISNLSFSAPYTLLIDRYGQEVAHYEFTDLAPGQQVAVSWEGDVEITALDYGIDPDQVLGLDQIPPDIVSTYTTDESLYRLDSPIIQNAAQAAADGATNPYWIARNVHDFAADRIGYGNDRRWDDVETIYLQRLGSCSEYTFLFVALCRANGLPARYVGGTRQRQEGTYVDTVFHRWAEVYLPPYGWVPVDVTHDDLRGGPFHTFFAAIPDDRFVITVSGGNSEYLGWSYHYKYRYDYSGTRPNIARERSITWQLHPSELRVNPASLYGDASSGSADTVAEELSIVSTNGSYAWSLDSATDWLRLSKNNGTTPDTVQVIADTTDLDLGVHTGQVVIRSTALDASITIPVEVSVMNESQVNDR